jgi:crotonobetainyl-CoA:carnitine CoA-transferase CaiB-like acyl-CoA transferase
MLPLAGVKVLDLGTITMGPYAGQWLGDLGADVVKVEPPSGDVTRKIGPYVEPGMGAAFLGLNRNKRGVVMDFKTESGREALMSLSDQADILLHNFRPDKMEKLGLGPGALRARNPRLVYACFHGFAEAGPYGGRPAYDDVIQGLCGLADLVAQRTGEPAYLPTVAADKTCGLIGAIAILAALSKRDRTGSGAYVEIPMFESMVAFTAVEHFYGHYFDPPRGPAAFPRVMARERRPFATANGYICVQPNTDAHWRNLFLACGEVGLADDPRFAGIAARTENVDALYSTLASLLRTRTTEDWLGLMQELDVPCGAVNALKDLTEEPHLAATEFFTRLDQGDGSRLAFPGVPVLFDGQRPPIRRPPRLGEHNQALLGGAGFDSQP